MNRQPIERVTERELHRHLSRQGIYLAMPPFVMHIRSAIPVVAQGIHALYGRQEFWVEPGEFADFHVEVNPRRQWWRPLCEFQADELQPFTPLAIGEAFALLEWGLNWCISGYCHNWVNLHAAVLERHGLAVIMPAPPGSGKSTLCAALMMHGWRLLSDELALLDPETGMLTPSPRPISLKNASIEVVRKLAPGVVMGPTAHDTLKGTVCHMRVTDDSLARAHELAKPAWVVFPRYAAGEALSVTERGKADALMELQRNAFNRHVHGHDGFALLADLVSNCGVFDLRYSQFDDALAWFDALAEQGGRP